MSRARTLALGVLLALVAACGYSAGLRVSERHQSVGVEFFGNESLERDVERSLHDQLTRSIRDLTDARIDAPARAEVVIRGVVKLYQRRGGVRDPDNRWLETGLTIAAEATLFDRASGRALGPPARAQKEVGYLLDDPRNEFEARERVLRYLADQLVLDLFAPVN